jgi:hypothetical protein
MVNFLFRIVVQAFLAALLAWSVEFATEEFGLSEIGHSHEYATVIQVIRPLIIFVAGLLSGATAYAWWKKNRESALWVWAGPVGILASALGLDTWRMGWREIVGDYFVWTRPGGDEPPLALYIFVLPAFSALAYSLGALISKRCGWARLGDASSTTENECPNS